MAAGFSESYVRIWSLKGEKLRGFKSNFNPAHINDCKILRGFNGENELPVLSKLVYPLLTCLFFEYKLANDLDRVRERNGTDSRKLIGHAGPVFGASFSPDNKYLITCSEDKTGERRGIDAKDL